MPEQVTMKLAESSHLGREGEKITLALTPHDVTEYGQMQTYLAGYRPEGMRADEASPVVLTEKDFGEYRTFGLANAFKRATVKQSIEANHPEIDPISNLNKYKVVDRFIGSFVNEITEQNAEPNIRLRQIALRRCQAAISIDRETDVWSLLTDTASWAAANVATIGVGVKWDEAGGNPIADIFGRDNSSAQRIKRAFMNRRVANAFLLNEKVQNFAKNMGAEGELKSAQAAVNTTTVSNADIRITGLPLIHVVDARVLDEDTQTTVPILGNHVVFVANPEGVPTDGEDIATTYTFRRRGNAGVGFDTREYRVENRGPRGGTMILVSMADIAVMTGNNVGGLLRDVLA